MRLPLLKPTYRPHGRALTVIIFLLLTVPILLFSLDPKKSIHHYVSRPFTTDHGLPQSTVRGITQTRDGYLWIGTYEGLARFDGMRFKVYNKANTPEFPDNSVNTLLKDRKEHLWVGTAGGIMLYDRNRFIPFTGADGLAGDHVITFYEDRSGVLWAGTTEGISRRRGKGFQSFSIPVEGTHPHVNAIAEDGDGLLWVGTNGGGLFHFKDDTFTLFAGKEILGSDTVWCIQKAPDNSMWLGTYKGLVVYRNGRYTYFDDSDGMAGTDVRDIYHDPYNVVWIADCVGGLTRYRDGVFTSIPVKDELLECSLRTLYEDLEGSLWIGSSQCGAIQMKDDKFVFFGKKNGLPVNAVRSVLQDKRGRIWLGTIGGGLVRLQGEEVKVYGPEHGLLSERIWSLALDPRDDSLWIGTYGHGLHHLKDERFTSFTTEQGLSNPTVRAMLVNPDGTVWAGTDGGGVDILKNGKIFRRYSTKNGLSDDFVYAIARAGDGSFWVGTVSGGINHIDEKKGTITFYSHKNTPEIPRAMMWALYIDDEGTLWAGNNGKGLLRFKEGKWNCFTSADGLCSDLTFQVLEDNLGYLWLNGNRGIFKVKKQELNDYAAGKIPRITSCESFGKAEGMDYTEASGPAQPAGWRDRDGNLWFPTTRGVVLVEPEQIPINQVQPPVVIEEIVVGEQKHSSPRNITVPPGTAGMEIHYTAPSFLLPDKMLFKYRLEGFEEQWRQVGNRRTAYYTNLPPGDFVFRVTACNSDGVWNTRGAALSLRIKPFFWQRFWFKLLAVLLAYGLVHIFFILRTRKVHRQREELARQVAQQTWELRDAREKADEARDAAEAANRSKGDFLARMSHEIRTPMNAVIGFTDMLMETVLDEEQREFVRSIHQSGDALLTVIDDILDFSRIEAGQLQFENIPFDPEVTVFDVCDVILPRMEDKPVEILCRIGDNVPARVKGDPGRFRQVLTNLVSNASKFTEKGEIELSMEMVERSETPPRIKLHSCVRDTGIGVAPDKLETIFQDFQQADGSITRQFGGTGLGLAICRQIALLMGGDVWAESSVGKGSTFHFTAWLDIPREQPPPPPGAPLLESKKILVVDDNHNNLETISHHLQKAGIRVETRDNGQQVIETLETAARAGEPFHLCIFDARMPGLDGCQLARRVREHTSTLAATPLLALSSSITQRAQVFQQCGFNGYLPKPVKRERLLEMVIRLLEGYKRKDLSGNGQTIVTRHSLMEEVKQGVSILLAEDNPLNRKLAGFLLEKAGYRLKMVENGEKAVRTFTQNPGDFDIILMDIQMPVLDGLSASREIRRLGFTDIPIVAMTAQSMKGDREKCLGAGMNDYISKPIKRGAVFKMVKKWCMKKQ